MVAMVKLCHARNDVEAMCIRAALQSADIPFHVQGENFGSLFPGLKIPYFNENRFDVPEENLQQALEIVDNLRQSADASDEQT